jgi:hypothetical protein
MTPGEGRVPSYALSLSGATPVDEDFASLLKADFRPPEDKFDIYQCLNNASIITPLHSTEGQ